MTEPTPPAVDTGQPERRMAGDRVPQPSAHSTGDFFGDAELSPARWWTRNPLRVKLVAAMLALVAFALLVVGAGSVVALRSILADRVDEQLAASYISLAEAYRVRTQNVETVVWVPADYMVAWTDDSGSYLKTSDYERAELPSIPPDLSTWGSKVGKPFTVQSADHRLHWRLLVGTLPGGHMVVIGEDLAIVENAVGRLILINTFVGTTVLLTLALVGAWLVRMSLRPLAVMERTAAAIAGGDLTQRVPELDPRTELGQFSSALNTMLSQIESAFRAREASEARAVRSEERMRQFVADASHELRTPLTTIRGFAELYRQGAAPDPGEVLRRIEDEAARMGLLVEDLLLLARLDRERPLTRVPVAMGDLIADAAAAAHAVAPERTVEVDIEQPADSLVVNGDEARLRQIIGNLVTNAITHTPATAPVTLRLRREGDDQAVIEVSDRGPGLTPEQAERVFERFYRVDKARTRQAARPAAGLATGLAAAPPPGSAAPAMTHTGTGLGLAIVAALVAAHDGTVEVESTVGEGATFRVRLPLAPS